MDASIDNILKKTAEYIEVTQPLIDQNNERRTAFLKRASEVADKLASRGLLSKDQIGSFLTKVAADETSVWELVAKLADHVGTDELGETAKVAAVTYSDPFDRWIMQGSARASQSSGVIE